jgi:hypothetical protein
VPSHPGSDESAGADGSGTLKKEPAATAAAP